MQAADRTITIALSSAGRRAGHNTLVLRTTAASETASQTIGLTFVTTRK